MKITKSGIKKTAIAALIGTSLWGTYDIADKINNGVDSFFGKEKKPLIEKIQESLTEETKETKKYIQKKFDGPENKKSYSAGPLKGANLGGLYKAYLGTKESRIGNTIEVDYSKNLEKMWDKKIQKYSSHKRTLEPAKDQIVEMYSKLSKNNDLTKQTLEEYIADANTDVKNIQKNIDWNKVYKTKHLNSEEGKLVKEIFHYLDGKDFVAYGLTELMPSKTNGKRNAQVLDHLLQTAGVEYVQSIPAMYDALISKGAYQLTSNAIADGTTKTNTSKLNYALPKNERIESNVQDLSYQNHHKAAALFALNNISDLVNSLNSKQRNILKKNYKKRKKDLVKFIATSHNKPRDSKIAAHRWIDNNLKHDYSVSCGRRIITYAKKTDNNYDYLEKL